MIAIDVSLTDVLVILPDTQDLTNDRDQDFDCQSFYLPHTETQYATNIAPYNSVDRYHAN